MKVRIHYGIQGEYWGEGGAKVFDLPFFPTPGTKLFLSELPYSVVKVHDAMWDMKNEIGLVQLESKKVCGHKWETVEWARQKLNEAGFTEDGDFGMAPLEEPGQEVALIARPGRC